MLRRFLQFLGVEQPTVDPLRDTDGDIIQTERATLLLFHIAKIGALLILAFGVYAQFWIGKGGFVFVIWGLVSAISAWLVGAILGLLFGLPSVVEVKLTDGAGASSNSNNANGILGYRESTNLEQVADWVTKILIGLTLTQYAYWQRAFEEAFVMSSKLMLPGVATDATPAAVISIGFAANGFLIAYLFMRRYFITEMVAGRKDTERKASAEIAAKKQAGLFQQDSVTKVPSQQTSDARSMAQTAVTLAPANSADAAKEIAEQMSRKAEYPDDPWRGKFNETNVADECRLDAVVGPFDGSDQFFTIKLNLTTSDPQRRSGQSATFYLHPTFGPDPKKVAFGPEGIATLELIAYGAFTVGVLLEDGLKLELNLATLSDAPELFRLR